MSAALPRPRPDGWPAWPVCDDETVEAAVAAIRSGRWAISGHHVGAPSEERQFADAFARELGAARCVPTTSGSSALLMCLQALDIGPGDEVLIPALTWVANATSVLNVGATPVLVDVDPATWCLDPAAVEAAMTPRVKAIVAVHLYGSMTDLDRLSAIATAAGVALIEDCAQAHGAAWRDHAAGTWGDLSAFSFQQGKLLTCGEGGAVVDANGRHALALEQLRADSRRMRPDRVAPGEMELEAIGTMQGSNHCLSEIHAAILRAQLPHLRAQNRRRADNAARLDAMLGELDGVTCQRVPAAVTRRSLYCYAFEIDPARFGGATGSSVAARLAAALGLGDFHVHAAYPPIHRNPLFCPWTNRRYAFLTRDAAAWRDQAFPVAERIAARGVVLHHSLLLAEPHRMADIRDALAQIRAAGP